MTTLSNIVRCGLLVSLFIPVACERSQEPHADVFVTAAIQQQSGANQQQKFQLIDVSQESRKQQFTTEQLNHKFGTTAGSHYLPDTAIDTDRVPEHTLSESVEAGEQLPYFEVARDVYFFYGNIAEVDKNNRGFTGNAGFIITSEGVVVIDSLGTPRLGRMMINTIRHITDLPIRYLIITHNHPDHAYGAVAFTDIPDIEILAHRGTRDYIQSGRMDSSAAYRRAFIEEDMRDFMGVIPEDMIDIDQFDKISLSFGQHQLDIYNVGALHSFGDLVVHDVTGKILWVSDLAFNNRLTYMADGHSQLAIEAHDWVLNNFMDIKLMIPGHGSVQTAPFPMVAETRQYMQRLRDTMSQAIDDDVDLLEAVEQSEFDDWKHVPLYELNQRPNSNFVYREMEQEQFE